MHTAYTGSRISRSEAASGGYGIRETWRLRMADRKPRSQPTVAVEERVLAALVGGDRPARFITEILRVVEREADAPGRRQIEQAVSLLEDRGVLLVRDHYCGDPHLEGIDLRIAGAVLPQADGEDAQSACVRAIEAAWTEWLTAYLAEHRCT